MTILLTNDDGIFSPGLRAVRERLETVHDVWTVAPDGERSGFSGKITIADPIHFVAAEERTFTSSGTPVDCVILATRGAIPVVPDVVISGINIGPNLGTDINYSGTCAAAREAAFRGIPGIALSLDSVHPPFHFDPLLDLVEESLATLVGLWNAGHFINVNAPNVAAPLGPRIATPAFRPYDDTLHPFEPPRGGTYYFVDGKPAAIEVEDGSDWWAVNQGYIAISPVSLRPVNDPVEAAYRESAILGER